jgi:hypothetical protein
MTDAIEITNIWSQHGGLVGLIILALFLTVWGILWKLIIRLMDAHQGEIGRMMLAQSGERELWRADIIKINDQQLEIVRETNVLLRQLSGPGKPMSDEELSRRLKLMLKNENRDIGCMLIVCAAMIAILAAVFFML